MGVRGVCLLAAVLLFAMGGISCSGAQEVQHSTIVGDNATAPGSSANPGTTVTTIPATTTSDSAQSTTSRSRATEKSREQTTTSSSVLRANHLGRDDAGTLVDDRPHFVPG